MELISVRVVLFGLLLCLVSTEVTFWEFIAEEDVDDVNSTLSSLSFLLTSTELKEEKQLLEDSSVILINEVTESIREELFEAQINQVSNMISEHTVPLYNILDQLRNIENESTRTERKLKVVDIFIGRNDSDQRINEIIESYY